MKIRTLLFLLFAFTRLFAQENHSFSLQWEAPAKTAYGETEKTLPRFQAPLYVYDNGKNALFASYTFESNQRINREDILIQQLSYQSVSSAALGELTPPTDTPSDWTIYSTRARDTYYTTLTFPAFRLHNGQLEQLTHVQFQTTHSPTNLQTEMAPPVATPSVLATGQWFRFYVEKSGVYKISKSFLQSLGFNTNVDPRTIKIYGNGGQMLPLKNQDNTAFDLVENAVLFVGEEDGTFHNSDYILMYAEGVDQWNEEYQTHLNIYANRSYYYVTAGGNQWGKRVQPIAQPATTALTQNYFSDYQYHETEQINIGRLGRRWMGETFNVNNEREFKFDFPGVIPTEPARIRVFGASTAYNSTQFRVNVNGNQVGQINFGALAVEGSNVASIGQLNQTFTPSESITVTLNYNNNGVPGSSGYLDWIIVEANRQLRNYQKQYTFKNNLSTAMGGISYQFAQASGIEYLWDVSDKYNAKIATVPNQDSFELALPTGYVHHLIVTPSTDYYSPKRENNARVTNQNLKTSIFTYNNQPAAVDYLIITPTEFRAAAEDLAQFHRSQNQLQVRVVELAQIYQEFGSGKQDIAAIRNFIRYVYYNAPTPTQRLQYVNLFGDASFDFKNRIPNNTNFVPIYHGINGFTTGEVSFTTDDFFGMMDENEGLLDSYLGSYNLGGIDVTVGRMIAGSPNQAAELVQKVKDYHNEQSLGSWRNNYILIADDSDRSSDTSLQQRQEQLSQALNTYKPFMNIEKIYLDAYQQESSSGGQRYPKARTDLFNAFEKGALILNYLGHGGEDGLSSERVWLKEDGQNLSNRFRYPLFITITCEFSRFDNPYRPTAGEYTYWNPSGGAISMITTVRSIGQFAAQNFNDRFSSYLLAYVNNVPTTNYTSIADALRRAKNASPDLASNIVTYLGDPALFLAVPRPQIRITHINEVAIEANPPALQALMPVKIRGQVQDENGATLNSFSGTLTASIFDKMQDRTTLVNDGVGSPMSFSALGETLFRGNATVTNGNFEFNFVVPRDIRVPLGNGRASFYAYKNAQTQDRSGVDLQLQVGGLFAGAVADNTGPQAWLYMNDESFVNGGITNSSPFLLAVLEDENGINTASGIGHDIVAILDGDESNPYVLNDYYEADVDNFRRGRLRFPFRNLAPGLHTITFTAWDVYNNPVRAEIQFVVVGDNEMQLTRVLNYPNPFTDYTEFWFSHNKPYEPLEVQVQVMTITGKIVWTKNQLITTEGFLSREITWDGKDDFGDKIGKGVYVYRLKVRSTISNTKAEKVEKLVIL